MGVLVTDANEAAVLEQIEFILETLERWQAPAPRLLLANKMDLPGAEESFTALKELYGDRLPCLPVSATASTNLDRFRRAVFDLLGIVRVYTKAPGKKADLTAPFILWRGETVLDAARQVHKDFADHLKYARLFKRSAERDGLMVERTHEVEDEDILEFHM